MRLSFTTLLFTITTIQAIYVPSTHTVHEKRDISAGNEWVKRDKLPRNAILSMRIGLQQSNLHQGEKHLMDVSHPKSKNYGKHWTADEVVRMFAPSKKTVESVTEWLVKSGIERHRIRHSGNKGWLSFDATVEEAEKLLYAEYHEYEHTPSRRIARACDSYHLPKHVRPHIDYITPGIKLSYEQRPLKLGGSRTKDQPPSSSQEKSVTAKKSQIKRNSRIGSRKFDLALVDSTVNYNPVSVDAGGVYSDELLTGANDLNSPTSTTQTCADMITPDCVKAIYGLNVTFNRTRSDNAMGIYEAYANFLGQEDLNTFFTMYNIGIPNGTFPNVEPINGAPWGNYANPEGGLTETDLDFEMAYPILYPQELTLYQDISLLDLDNFLNAIDGSFCSNTTFNTSAQNEIDLQYTTTPECGTHPRTNVISFSYSGAESSLPILWQERQCNEFLKLGLQGVSLIFSSGDFGVSDRTGSCLTSSSNPSGTIFSPAWPVSCPWITTVGATTVGSSSASGVGLSGDEVVASSNNLAWSKAKGTGNWSSAGGFSNIYPRPSYQNDSLNSYFRNSPPSHESYIYTLPGNLSADDAVQLGDTGNGLFNAIGRGYPDVSALGGVTSYVANGVAAWTAGSSVSAPIFASIINLINEERLNAGKRTVGFINVALYANPQLLNDVTSGNNMGCGMTGFNAVTGWDPVTGLGTPNYQAMRKFWNNLP